MRLKRFFIILNNLFKLLFKINLRGTIYFNFKVLPFHQAILFPFHFFGKTDFEDLSGEFVIQAKKIHFGMIVFGGKHEVVISSNVPTRICNSGRIEFNGESFFARGINLYVLKNGKLSFGNNFSLGSLSRIICFRKIHFGNDVLISWECQFFDTDFHFIINDKNFIKDNCGDVFIDDGIWIGARSTILKNTILAKKTIVGANSVCSGNYDEKYGEGVLICGIPAKLLKREVAYLLNRKQELKFIDHFYKNQNSFIKLDAY